LRLLLRGALGLAAVLALAWGAGLALPREVLIRTQEVMARPPETIWRVLLDFDGMPLWRSDLTRLERLPDLAGLPAWREVGKHATRVMALTVAEPPRRLILRRTVSGSLSLPIRTFELVPAQTAGTLVTLTELIRVNNPLWRVLWRIRPPRGELVRLLRDLDQRLVGAHRQVAKEP
jgi:hypothetical protein